MTNHLKFLVAAVAVVLPAALLAGGPNSSIKLKDPADDDFGPGTYTYPTDAVYAPKSFDLRSVEIIDKGATVQFKVKLGARVRDPWNSREWDGNDFSLRLCRSTSTWTKAGGGYTEPLPGLGSAKFKANEAWDKLVLLSPQGKTRLGAEVRYKAKKMRKDVIIPKSTRARGKYLIAVVSKSPRRQRVLLMGGSGGGAKQRGLPDLKDILTRRVNENKGNTASVAGTTPPATPTSSTSSPAKARRA